ncbi:MAG: Na/Pi cotransporter family protein [Oscillospiraceae bacterium]|nr:Na/Pi cotransporter family protein [Oscillospiraceae bacterium]
MMSVSEIISLLSGVAMFLFGMTLMGDGLKRVAGSKLELVLYRLSNTTLKGVLLGTGVTAVIQSSCATSVMVVGFVNSGMMKVRQAISVIIGAILGTSITGWVISLSYIEGSSGVLSLLSTATLTGVVAVVGIFLRVFSKKQVHHHIGDILMGFAVLMFGMSAMSGSVSNLGKQVWFTNLLTSLSNPLLGILAGAVFTAVLQSASAAVGIVQALSVTGAMSFDAALPLLMGIAIGASVPVLLSALGASTDGKRTALVYLVAEIVSVTVCAAIFYVANAIFRFSFTSQIMNPFSIAFVNTILRLAMVLLLIPFTDLLEALVAALIPKKPEPADELFVRLEERFIAHPTLAVEQSRLTINDMALSAREALNEAFGLVTNFNAEGLEHVKKLEDDGDRYEDSLGSYLIRITGQEMTRQQNADVSKYLHSIPEFERVSDHALNIAESAAEIHDKGIVFSANAQHELSVVTAAVKEIMDITTRAFVDNDLDLAIRIEPLKSLIEQLSAEVKMNHVERLQKGQCTIRQGFVLNDLLTYMERVGDHCSNVGVAMIELASDAFETHKYVHDLKNDQSPEFRARYEEYKQTFAL